jgi:hypothetical protein
LKKLWSERRIPESDVMTRRMNMRVVMKKKIGVKKKYPLDCTECFRRQVCANLGGWEYG